MASDTEATCENDPNFAVICAFFEKFGSHCGLPSVDFLELQGMIEDTDEVHPDLVNIFLKLLRRVKKTVKPDKWEKSLVAVCHNFSSQDAWEIERFGYKKAKLTSKVRVLKELLEMQFDFHMKFKNEVNKLSANDLRSKPLGRDKAGHVYWFQNDDNYQIRVYKEDYDEQTWALIAKDREGLVSLMEQLTNGENKCLSDASIEESNLSENPVIDTGQNDAVTPFSSNTSSPGVVSETFLMKDEKVVETEHTEEKPKPKLRIKNICELIDTRMKRPKFEDDSETRTKYLKINVNRVIVDETIEEPVMRINMEGNGVDNDDSPIIGEMIEEKVLYVYGEGSGFACQTGKGLSTSNQKYETCDYQTDSINILGGSRDLNKKKCDEKLDYTDVEIGNNSCNSSLNSSFNTEQYREKLATAIVHPNVGEDITTEITEQSSCGSAKTSTHSPLMDRFGKSIETKFVDTEAGCDVGPKTKCFLKSCERTESEPKNTKKKIESIAEEANLPSKGVIENNSNDRSKSECKVGSSEHKSDDAQNDTLKIDHSIKVDNAENQSPTIRGEDLPDTVPIIEELCIKKVAYTCGGNDIAKATISWNNEKEDMKTIVENEETNTKVIIDEDERSELKNPDQMIIDVKEKFKSDCTGTSNLSEIGENPSEFKEYSGVIETVPKMSLRSVRNKKVLNVPDTHAEITPSYDPSVKKQEIDVPTTEVIYVKGRRCRQKKDWEVTPPITATKIPKLTVTTGKDKEGQPKRAAEKDQDMKYDNGKYSVASPNSSQVSSPVSNAESISTFVGSVDNNSLGPLEKDPLAESDRDEIVPKPTNLQSLSFDYNDSSTPPPIPIIPSTRLLRKRDREISPSLKSSPDNQEKRRKVKGKRLMDTKLRKSIEQLKEQQVSSSDEDTNTCLSPDSTKKCKSRPKKKRGRMPKKKKASIISTSDNDSKSNAPPKSMKPVAAKKKNCEIVRHPENRNKRLLAGMDVAEIQLNSVRQSRRLAQIKIKEQVEQKKTETTAKDDKEGRKEKSPKKLKKDIIVLSSEPEQEHDDTKKKKKKAKAPSKIFDEYRPWKSSSESSEEDGEELEDEEEIIEEEPPLEFESDHEFSPESDLNSSDEYQPPKRARTARKKYDDDSIGNKKEEDFPCQKCGKSDHPETVLLCDNCDNGWHCSCLHPPLLIIPEGDWFCPPCQHVKLVENLHAALTEYDKKLAKKGIEDRRKERLAYVGISLNNVLPSREKEQHKNKRQHSAEAEESTSTESESSGSESGSGSDEPIYQLRQRRQARSYKFNEFDELIKSAIQDELNEKDEIVSALHSRGKDMATIVKAEEGNQYTKESTDKHKEPLPGENTENNIESKHENGPCIDEVIKPSIKFKKKNRKMCSLDLSSEEDDERDEDFKGSSSSSDEDEEFEDESENSDESMLVCRRRKNSKPLRRSTRTRVSRFESNFIDDDEEDDNVPKKKKRVQSSNDSDSSECDISWKGKKKKGKSDSAKKRAYKKKKNSILEELSDLEVVKKKKHRIKYGGLTSSDEDMGRGRRTRGKKTTYVDTLGSDSEDAPKMRNSRKLNSDDDDDEDFVAFEEDEKDSEEAQDDHLEDDDDEEKNGEVKKPETLERRPLIVPKIYIKKPPVSKDFERTKERNIISEVKESVNNQKGPEQEKLSEKNISKRDQTMNEDEKQIVRKNLVEKTSEESECLHISSEKVDILPRVESAKHVTTLSPKLSNFCKDIDKDSEHSRGNQYVKPDQNLGKQNITEQEQIVSIRSEIIEKEVFKEKETKESYMQLSPQKKTIPDMKDKKAECKLLPDDLSRKPIVDNVRNMLRNDDTNDELSEPPMGVGLPLFEELSSKSRESTSKNRDRGRGKKTLEEAVDDLGGKKKSQMELSQGEAFNIEIATPPLPFSQAAPTPSVITKMLQTKPGQTSVYPIGSIRPKQFATMPDDDDDSPSNRSRNNSSMDQPSQNDSSGQYMLGGSKSSGISYRNMYINQYPRRMLPPHQMRPPPSTDITPRQIHMMPSPRSLSSFITPNAAGAPPSYYEGYPSEPTSNEDDIPTAAYDNPQYPESYESEVGGDPSVPRESSNKHYGGEELGGEFGGLVSYFSSQQEDDM